MYKTNFKLFYSLITLWRMDESVIQGLLEMPFSRSVVEKLKKERMDTPAILYLT
jgi:hypothetical protein